MKEQLESAMTMFNAGVQAQTAAQAQVCTLNAVLALHKAAGRYGVLHLHYGQ